MYIILELERLETSEYIIEFGSGIGKGCIYEAWTSSTKKYEFEEVGFYLHSLF